MLSRWSTLKTLWQLGRPHRSVWFAACFCMIGVALATGAYAALMGPGLQALFLGRVDGLKVAGLQFVLTRYGFLGLAGTVVVVGLTRGLGYAGQFYFSGLYGHQIVSEVRRRIFRHMGRLSVIENSQTSGELLHHYVSEAATIEQAAVYGLSSVVRDSLQVAALIFVAVSISPKLFLASVIFVPLILLGPLRMTRRLMKRVKKSQTALTEVASRFNEGVMRVREIQVMRAQPLFLSRIKEILNENEKHLTRAGWYRAWVPALVELSVSTLASLLLVVAANRATLPLYQLLSFFSALVLMVQPLKDIGRTQNFVMQASVAFDRLSQLILSDEQGSSSLSRSASNRNAPMIEMRHCSLSYGRGDVLTNLSVTIHEGECVAVMGESGAGKTSLIRMLLGYLNPTEGTYLFKGQKPYGVLRSFAWVTQEPMLFGLSICENLRIANPSATDADIEDALRASDAFSFVSKLENGANTLLREVGHNLSGGQRQRLCLARALLSDAEVWLLDEPTANLDARSESDVLETIKKFKKKKTILIVTHRPQVASVADKLIVISKGGPTEYANEAGLLFASQGSHERCFEVAEKC